MSTGAMQQVMASAEGGGFRRGTTARTHHRCVACRERRSLFRYRGVVKADADHTLCFQCYRSVRDRVRPHRFAPWMSAFQFPVRKECL